MAPRPKKRGPTSFRDRHWGLDTFSGLAVQRATARASGVGPPFLRDFVDAGPERRAGLPGSSMPRSGAKKRSGVPGGCGVPDAARDLRATARKGFVRRGRVVIRKDRILGHPDHRGRQQAGGRNPAGCASLTGRHDPPLRAGRGGCHRRESLVATYSASTDSLRRVCPLTSDQVIWSLFWETVAVATLKRSMS